MCELYTLKIFSYYKGDWVNGRILLAVYIHSCILEADILFGRDHGIDPRKSNISVSVVGIK